ncbi:MAG TPA: hypothetical protein VFX76_20260, partial [Roseiflexaceae bacterium]|nr:hypothetical protein [Roseiflexaceae bacterium]
RVGRGVWNRKPEVAISWDEPEAYRTLVHEWAHYALALRDAYLGVVPANDTFARMRNRPERSDAPDLYRVVVPQKGITSTSIMATPEGNSELDNPIGMPDDVQQTYYPKLSMPAGYFAGPGQLPLPLPNFHRVGALATSSHTQLTLAVPSDLKDERCLAYVLKGPIAQPWRIVAQGTLDARSRKEGFQLLGAEVGDTVVLIEHIPDQLNVRSGTIESIVDSHMARITNWVNRTPEATFLIDVQPEKLQSADLLAPAALTSSAPADTRRAAVKVRIKLADGHPPDNMRLSIAPFDTSMATDQPGSQVVAVPLTLDAPIDVPSLDGHILITMGDRLIITSFSQGGSPRTAPNVPTNPITAGSSDGEALLFFHAPTPSEDQRNENARVRVITTTQHGLPDQLPDGARARSNAYAIASNTPFLAEFIPTLVILNDVTTMAE